MYNEHQITLLEQTDILSDDEPTIHTSDEHSDNNINTEDEDDQTT